MLNAHTFVEKVSFKSLSVRDVAIFSTLLMVLISFLLPASALNAWVQYFVLILVLAGILHGASDYFIFRELGTDHPDLRSKIFFYLTYCLAIAGFATIWYFVPQIALALFLIVSIMHFGQSNWHSYNFSSRGQKMITYLLWGSFVTLTPLLIHLEESLSIINEIAVVNVPALFDYQVVALQVLMAFNIGWLGYLFFSGVLTFRDTGIELGSILLLAMLYFSTPLLLGFAVYFAFWHSLRATADQITLLRAKVRGFDIKKYSLSLILLSLVAFAGLGVFYYLAEYVLDFYFGWGMLFLFISIITVPHSLFIDKVYSIKLS